MSVSLEVTKREVRPRSLRNKLRHEGKVPAIVNGYKVESTPIAVNAAELEKILRENGLNTVITISLEGKKVNTLIKEYQSDTFTRNLTHVEFLSVDMNEETEVEAEVTLIGESAGVKAGGVLAQNLYTVVVSATPDKLPERVEIDVTSLEIGDSLTVADLPKNDEYTIVTDPEEQIVA
ncbi:50S ribosomal protein L25/general stress protein Ctc, partial [Listeria monocytogenes]|nr:50S ribosomal protein L25/general stress protein Ctc [Listeria monocytogenes]